MTFILLTWKFSFHEKTSKVIKGLEIMKVYPSVICVLAGHSKPRGMFCYLTIGIMRFSEYVPHGYRYMCMCVCVCKQEDIVDSSSVAFYLFWTGI